MPRLHLLLAWRTFPGWMRARLLHGSVGAPHRLALASDALAAATTPSDVDTTLFHTGRDLLLAAWEEDPCNGQLAAQLLALHKHAPWLSQGLVRILGALRDAWHRPSDLAPLEHLARNGDWDGILTLCEAQATRTPRNIFWVQQALTAADLAGKPERASALVASMLHGELAPLATYLEACRLAASDALSDVAAALTKFRAASLAVNLAIGPHGRTGATSGANTGKATTSGPAPENRGKGAWLAPTERTAHCMARLGARDGALALWHTVLTARPWHTSLILRAHDMACGLHTPLEAAPGRTAVLLYSWNKAHELDTALHALAASLDDIAVVACLDNGSTDATGSVITGWAERIGRERFIPVSLPVNTGAAAARNWLMQLPEVAACDFTAYLDDDATVPADWLRHFARAVSCFPAASAWGCRIVDWHAPALVQSADLHLVPRFDMDAATRDASAADVAFSPMLAHGMPFTVSDLHNQTTDQGYFDHIRPCLSVTGCCHLFRTAELRAQGGFSLALSPSQYDDLEHDLRAARNGQFACYNGFLAVRHMKRTGKATRMSGAQFGNALGNRYKLHGMYSPEDIMRIHSLEQDILERDLLRRMALLETSESLR